MKKPNALKAVMVQGQKHYQVLVNAKEKADLLKRSGRSKPVMVDGIPAYPSGNYNNSGSVGSAAPSGGNHSTSVGSTSNPGAKSSTNPGGSTGLSGSSRSSNPVGNTGGGNAPGSNPGARSSSNPGGSTGGVGANAHGNATGGATGKSAGQTAGNPGARSAGNPGGSTGLGGPSAKGGSIGGGNTPSKSMGVSSGKMQSSNAPVGMGTHTGDVRQNALAQSMRSSSTFTPAPKGPTQYGPGTRYGPNASYLETFAKPGALNKPGQSMNLDPDFAKAMVHATQTAIKQGAPIQPFINEATRNRAIQAGYYAHHLRDPNFAAAAPGSSSHQYGVGMDVDVNTPIGSYIAGNKSALGLQSAIPSKPGKDYGHVSLAGSYGNLSHFAELGDKPVGGVIASARPTQTASAGPVPQTSNAQPTYAPELTHPTALTSPPTPRPNPARYTPTPTFSSVASKQISPAELQAAINGDLAAAENNRAPTNYSTPRDLVSSISDEEGKGSIFGPVDSYNGAPGQFGRAQSLQHPVSRGQLVSSVSPDERGGIFGPVDSYAGAPGQFGYPTSTVSNRGPKTNQGLGGTISSNAAVEPSLNYPMADYASLPPTDPRLGYQPRPMQTLPTRTLKQDQDQVPDQTSGIARGLDTADASGFLGGLMHIFDPPEAWATEPYDPQAPAEAHPPSSLSPYSQAPAEDHPPSSLDAWDFRQSAQPPDDQRITDPFLRAFTQPGVHRAPIQLNPGIDTSPAPFVPGQPIDIAQNDMDTSQAQFDDAMPPGIVQRTKDLINSGLYQSAAAVNTRRIDERSFPFAERNRQNTIDYGSGRDPGSQSNALQQFADAQQQSPEWFYWLEQLLGNGAVA